MRCCGPPRLSTPRRVARSLVGREGVRFALGLLDAGVPRDEVIVNVLAAAQREIGERWVRNECSVADEHLATGVAQRALDVVADSFDAPHS